MKENQVHHNYGKPEVLKMDTGSLMYFPGHVAVSINTCLAARRSPESAAILAIDANLFKAGVVTEFVARPQADAPLLTALAEVHSKAAIFRETDSQGFNFRAKNLDKRGKPSDPGDPVRMPDKGEERPMTEEQLKALLLDPDAKSFWPTAKPQVGAAREALEKAERKARNGLLQEHLKHYRHLRGIVSNRCGEEGGHDVEQPGGTHDVFGDRLCKHCRLHFPRWTPCGPWQPEIPHEDPGREGTNEERHEDDK